MSEENNVATIEAPKTAAKPKAKPAAKKLAPKAKPEKKEAEHGTERKSDLPWCDKKVAVFKALKALNAVNAASARPTDVIAKKANVKPRDVRHYCYHAKAAQLVSIADLEEHPGWCFYLTAKGQKVDPVAALKEQNAK